MTEFESPVFQPNDKLNSVLMEVNESLPLRKIEEMLERTDLSADAKSIVLDVAHYTIVVGDKIIALGRKLVSFAIELAKTIPNTLLGVVAAAGSEATCGYEENFSQLEESLPSLSALTGHWCRHLILRCSMSLRPFAQSAALSLLNRLCEDFLVVSCSTECKAFMKAYNADEMHQNFGIRLPVGKLGVNVTPLKVPLRMLR